MRKKKIVTQSRNQTENSLLFECVSDHLSHVWCALNKAEGCVITVLSSAILFKWLVDAMGKGNVIVITYISL